MCWSILFTDIPNVAVIITDGQSNVNHELTIPEARSLKATGATIITVAVGFTSETSELVGLTSPPVIENLIYVSDYESLDKLKDQLIDPLCSGKFYEIKTRLVARKPNHWATKCSIKFELSTLSQIIPFDAINPHFDHCWKLKQNLKILIIEI